MLTRRPSEDSGFTLVEATIAGVLLAIGILGSVTVFDSSRREAATGERLQVAQALAEAELERMRDVAYADLATDSAEAWPESGTEADPSDRVAESEFLAREADGGDGGTEQLVQADAGTGIDPYSEPENVTVDGDSFETQVYRFVSWRDVECQIVDLAPLKARYNNLLQALSTRLNNIAGPGGRIDQILNLPVLPIIGRLPGVVRHRLNDLDVLADELRTAILLLIDAIEALDEIDPCDADLEALNAIDETASALNPLLTAADNALVAYRAACFNTMGVSILCPNSPSPTYHTLATQISALESNDYRADFTALADSVAEIGASHHEFNTKRVTVAVVMKPASGSGPFLPVWSSSVVSDPEAGLLGG